MAKKRKSQKKKSGVFEFTRIAFGVESYGKRQFKRDLKKLKKAGLLSAKIDIDLQAPTKYMLSQIRKFSAVLQGTAKTIEIPRAEKEFYKNAGYPVKATRAIIEAPKGSRVKRLPSENGVPRVQVTQRGQGGTKRSVRVLLPYTELERYITDKVMKEPPLKRGEYYGFRFYGNNSLRYFANSGDGGDDAKQRLLAYFLKYNTVEEAERSEDPEQAGEIYRNFEVVKFENKGEWNEGVKRQRESASSQRREANREKYNEWRRRKYAAMDALEKREYNERRRENATVHAERERNRRARIAASNPDLLLKQREAGKIRAAKSRAAKRNKK